MPTDNLPFLQFDPGRVTPEIKALFSQADPASLRCFAVLDDHAAGRIFTDHPETPTWAVLQEGAFGSLYLGGNVPRDALKSLVAHLRTDGDVLAGLWQDDPRSDLFPPSPDYSGYTLEFTDRAPGKGLPALPAGCELHNLDPSLGKQILGRNLLIHMYGSLQQALQWGYGLCLLRKG